MDDRDSVPRWILWGVAIAATAWITYALRGVLAPVFFAFLIAYMLDPLVDRFEAMPLIRSTPIARGMAIAVLLLVVFMLTAVLLLIIAPLVIQQVSSFVKGLPALVEGSRKAWEPILAELGLTVPSSVADALEQLHLDIQGLVAKSYAPVSAALRWLLGGTANALDAVIAAIVIPVFAFYLTHDFDRIVERAAALVPPRYRTRTYSFFRDIDRVLGQFFRGQFTVMAILAVLYSVGYGIISVPLALPIGIMAGFLSFIPYVGSLTALGAALLMTLLDWQGWTQIVWVLGVHFVIQGLEGLVITPKIMGENVGISAVAVLFALMVGGELLGFMGVLLAVPAAAVVKVLVDRVGAEYIGSEFFDGPKETTTNSSSEE
jgi:predicted PurR-regulated permease PerM